MTDLDLERLGDVWRQQPDPKELDELKRAAEAVRRRARLAQVVDVVAAIVVAGVVLFMSVSNPAPETAVIGGAAILLLLGSQIRQRRLRRIEISSLTGDAESMLNQSIERTEAKLARTRFSLIGLAPGLVIGLAFGTLAKRGAGREVLVDLLAGPWPRTVLLILIPMLLLAAWVFHLWLSLRRGREELARLKTLRDAWRQEADSASVE